MATDDATRAALIAALLVVPAMNREMWAHPATQRNVAQVKADGAHLIGPASGDQACGETGDGRMLEAQDIFDEIEGRVRRAVYRKGELLIPKGATLKGNIALLERRKDFRGQDRTIVALQWREISFDGKTGPFEGQLEEGGAIPVSDSSNRGIYQKPTQRELAMLPHRDVFYVRKDFLDLPVGLPLNWRTVRPGGSGAKKP